VVKMNIVTTPTTSVAAVKRLENSAWTSRFFLQGGWKMIADIAW
jgi:hypothetical protein